MSILACTEKESRDTRVATLQASGVVNSQLGPFAVGMSRDRIDQRG